MNINQDFFDYIKPYLFKLRDKIGDDFVVFGSAPLYLLGAVDFNGSINDLDVFIKDISVVPEDATPVTFHKNQEQKLYKIIIDDLEVDMGSYWPGYDGILNNVFSNPIKVGGFKFANLDVVEEWKKEMVKKYDRQKDKDYLIKIQAFRRK
jgi:hypothetical protein